MLALSDGETRVRRVRIRGATADPLAARLRAAALVGGADLRPAGLAPGAVLCIRRFPDPRPGSIALRRPPARPPATWERAAATALDRFARIAARPADGAVPCGAEAVLFADPAEMLACLGLDWLDGTLAGHWWWPTLLGAGADLDPLSAWLDSPRYVPAALTALADRGRAREFVQALSEAEAQAVVRTVVAKHEAPALLVTLDTALPGTRGAHMRAAETATPSDQPAASAPDRATTAPDQAPTVPAVPAAPWAHFAPQADAGLPIERQTLLGVALSLHRAPHIARTTAFAEAVREWRISVAAVIDRESTRSANRSVSVVSPRPNDVAATPVVDHSVAPSTPDEPTWSSAVTGEMAARPSIEPLPECSSFPHDRPAPGVPPAVTDTEFAGVFYLVNLALFLDLYGDFTSPARPGIALPIWDVVTLVGRELLGERSEADPVWDLLARLAGRDPLAPAGGDFVPPAEWRVPADWQRHPTGFDFPDVARTAADSPLRRWLAWLMPYIRGRLHQALRPAGDRDAGQLLCTARGRILVTPAHIDVLLSLADLPLEVRLAGLDRDPGWVPAAGRVIAFRFN